MYEVGDRRIGLIKFSLIPPSIFPRGVLRRIRGQIPLFRTRKDAGIVLDQRRGRGKWSILGPER